MLVSTMPSLSCFSGAEMEALSPTAAPCRIAFGTIRLDQRKNTPERPSPRVFTSNCGKHDARPQDNPLGGLGFRGFGMAKLHSCRNALREGWASSAPKPQY